MTEWGVEGVTEKGDDDRVGVEGVTEKGGVDRELSLVGATASVIFVATNVLSQQIFVMTDTEKGDGRGVCVGGGG